MEKESGGSFAPTIRKTAEDDENEEDWDLAANILHPRQNDGSFVGHSLAILTPDF